MTRDPFDDSGDPFAGFETVTPPATAPGAREPDPDEVPGYTVTRDELEILARHWFRRDLDVDMFCFAYSYGRGRSERLAQWQAWDRLERLAGVLDASAMTAARTEVEDEERQQIGESHWQAFRRWAPEEQLRLTDEMYRESHRLRAKAGDAAACEAALAHLRVHVMDVFRDPDGDLWYWATLWFPGFPRSDRLHLMVRSAAGGGAVARGHEIVRPADWRPPFGLK